MIHPIEFRYCTDEMRKIFEQENIVAKKLLVEAAIAKAHAKLGTIPKESAEEIAKHANTKEVTLERIAEIEKETQHDVMALVKALSEKCGDSGNYVHLGATSYDIIDTSWALIFKEAIDVLLTRLQELKKVLVKKTTKYKSLVMVGRTHGQHATPITLGLKFAVWLAEVQRHVERLERAKEIISVGKMTGAVGTGAALGEKAVEVQTIVMKELGLKGPLVTTQVVQRDRYAEIIFGIALIAGTLEKIGKEIRNLQRTEIGELEEAFGKKQVGSSTMPHKRNPWKSENVCGIARYLRSNVAAALENIALEHERDLTNSSCERIIFPESFILCDFISKRMIKIVGGLTANEDNIKKNLELSKGRIMGEAVMLKLVERGMGRQEAHEVIRELAMQSFKENMPLGSVLVSDKRVNDLLSGSEIKEVLKPENYIGSALEQIENVLKIIK